MRSPVLIRGLMTACTLALAAATLPAAAFIGNFRGPKVDGELALPGLSAPVRVHRDEHGIPYIFAANTPDLIRAQGFVVAQGRLFQIEGYRAIATGGWPNRWGRAAWPATVRSACWGCAAMPSAMPSCCRPRRATS